MKEKFKTGFWKSKCGCVYRTVASEDGSEYYWKMIHFNGCDHSSDMAQGEVRCSLVWFFDGLEPIGKTEATILKLTGQKNG